MDPFAGRQRRAEDAALNAQLTRGLKDDLSAQRNIESIAKARLDIAKKGTDDFRNLRSAYVQEFLRAQSIQDQIAVAAEAARAKSFAALDAAARKLAATRKDAAEKQKAALEEAREQARERREAIVGRARNEIAVAKIFAARTETNVEDDLAVLGRETRLLRRVLKGTKKFSDDYVSIVSDLDENSRNLDEKRKEAIGKQRERTARLIRRAGLRGVLGATPAQGAAEFLRGSEASGFALGAQQLLEDLSGLLGRFSSDILTAGEGGRLTSGSRPVTIEQHFHADRSQSSAIREARLAAIHNL